MTTAVLRRTAGQLFMVGLPGPALDDETRGFLAEYTPGGVILFKRNVTSGAQLRRLVGEVKATGAGVPPLVGIDHEGGRVNRLPRPFTHFPPALTVAAGGPAAARRVGQAMGRELAAVGIDLDFAPVLDVWSHPRNRVIGDRAFGTTAAAAARGALALADGLASAGVVACGKHFPGHGGTAGDSHHVRPRLRRSRPELERVDLVPFRRAIAARIPTLMTAHVVYPALDPRRPATLSRRICHDLLRRRLGFQGLLFSDDLEMHSVARRPIERTVLEALAAGCDMLLVCASLDLARRGIDAVARAIDGERLDPERVAASLARIQVLRRRHRPRPVERLGWPAHGALARRLASAARIPHLGR
jgi:beta-N-acetylhexosaminidase